MSEDGRVLCQQCNDAFAPDDVKQIYGEDLEICGFICNPCCIKSVEYARRCQIVDCKTRPDSGPTGFRTLPSKFYDLPEGEVKKRIIKQFGIIRTVRACCNMCYVRISKAIVQMKIVYGDGLPRQSKISASRTGKYKALSSTHNVVETTKTPQAKEDRLAEYTGPKFTRRSGGAPCWNKNNQKTEENIVPTNFSQNSEQIFEKKTEKDAELSVDNKQLGDNTLPNEGEWHNSNQEVLDSKGGDDKQKGLNVSSGHSTSQIEINEVAGAAAKFNNSKNEKGGKNEGISYSSTPISPTSMRFRRIQPKLPKFEEFDLSDDLLELADFSPPGTRNGRKRSRGADEDETWSPEKAKRERMEGKGVAQKRPVNTNVMSDFVSCTGCRKICSSKETKPVFDEKKGLTIRLCSECRSKRKEEIAVCPMKGCLTAKEDVVLKPLPSTLFNQKGNTKKQLQALGFNEEMSSCCEKCLQVMNSIVSIGDKDRENGDSNGEEQVFTMCRSCCKIIPMKDTFPNIEDDGRKCGVVCPLCIGKDKKDLIPHQEADVKKETKIQKKTKLYESSMKTLGFCTAKGCVHAGEKDPVQLVCGKKILRNYLDEKMLRAEFDLDDDTDYCCRSCHARIKWFVADIKKKEHGPGADGKAVNSLKNLNPRIKAENAKQEDGKHSQEKKSQEIKEEISKSRLIASDDGSYPQGEIANCALAVHSPSGLGQEMTENKADILVPHSEGFSNQSPIILQTPAAVSTKPAIFMPPMSTSVNNLAGHPPVLQVGRQQFVLNVISRCEKETQTQKQFEGQSDYIRTCSFEKGVQANIPLMPEFEGTVPANLPNGKKVKYADAKEKTKYAVKRAGKKLFDQFLQQLDDISGGCAHQLLSDIYRPKDSIMATNYEKILASIGTLYKNTERGNRQERLRLLSTVALHATNEALKRYFQRMSKKGDIVSVNEAEIVQAREYAKQFGPGTHVMPVGQVSWKNLVSSGMMESAEDEDANEAEKGDEKDSATRASKGGQVDPKTTSEGEKLNVDKGDKGQLDESSENSGSLSGELSPDTQTMGKDKEKKLITFEKMNPSEQGSAEKKQKQLVTFKVTVRHSKDKTGDGTEQKGVVNDDTAESEVKANSDNADKGEEKNVNTEKLAGKRNGKQCHDSGKEDSKSHMKKRRRNTFSGGTTEKSKRKSDVTKSDDKDGDMREKRRRTAFSNERKMVLEKYFEKSIYASKLMVEEISRELGIDRKKIDNWFRNRRSKLKKDEEERSRRDVEMKERKGWNKENSKSSSVDAKEADIRNIPQAGNGNPEEGQGKGSPEEDRFNGNPEVDRGNGNPEVDERKENAQTKGSDAEPVVAGKEDNVSATKIEEGEQRTSANNVEAEGIEPSTENSVTTQIKHVSTDVKRPHDSQTLLQTEACQGSQETYEVKQKPDPGQHAINKKRGSISDELRLSPDQKAACAVSKITSDSSHYLEKNVLNKDRSHDLKNDLRTKSKIASTSGKISDLSSESNCAIINKKNKQTSANATSNGSLSLLAPPVLSDLAPPVLSDVASPVVSDLTSPVVSGLTSPVVSGLTSPVVSDLTSPDVLGLTSPVVSDLTSPVVSDLTSPVVSDLASPVVSDPNAIVLAPSVISQSRSGETFLSKQECYIGSRVVPETSWSSVIDEYDVEVNGDESNAPEDLALALNNDPDFMKDLNELMDIAKA